MQLYSAQNITILKGLEAVRKRPGMYIGDTGITGFHHLIWEILDNSVDEALSGRCDKISVIISGNDDVIVIDNGRGIPVDIHPLTGKNGIETVFTNLHAGGKFDKATYKISGGLHGVGASVVTALSEFLNVVVHRSEYTHRQNFGKGGRFISHLSSFRVNEKIKKHGTTVSFRADKHYFEPGVHYDYQIIKEHLQKIAYLNAKLSISFQFKDKKEEIFYYEKGISEFLTINNLKKENLGPIFDVTTEQNEMKIQVAVQFLKTDNESLFSYCNSISTTEGGSHVTGFKNGIRRAINKYILMFKLATEQVSYDDIAEGLTAIVSILHPNPMFTGQTKRFLVNKDAEELIFVIMRDKFFNFLVENKDISEKIINYILLNMRARKEAQQTKDLIKKGKHSSSVALPGKLADCASENKEETEIFFVEGESAGGSAKLGRNREYQAILALKGKVINSERNTFLKITQNDEIRSIIASLGCGIQREFIHDNLRYGKVIIMTDADVDGEHIKILLLTFFYRYMKVLLEQGNIFVACPPLYKIQAGQKYKYCYSETELEKEKEIFKNDKFNIQRYKGLGEMNPQQLWDTTMDPSKRILRKVIIDDAIAANNYFEKFLGDDPTVRKEFIYANAEFVKNISF